jgi:hypothetical protein
MILPRFADPHPRVRWAACNTFGQMFTDFGPTIQAKHHDKVLPALMSVMDDKDNPRFASPPHLLFLTLLLLFILLLLFEQHGP